MRFHGESLLGQRLQDAAAAFAVTFQHRALRQLTVREPPAGPPTRCGSWWEAMACSPGRREERGCPARDRAPHESSHLAAVRRHPVGILPYGIKKERAGPGRSGDRPEMRRPSRAPARDKPRDEEGGSPGHPPELGWRYPGGARPALVITWPPVLVIDFERPIALGTPHEVRGTRRSWPPRRRHRRGLGSGRGRREEVQYLPACAAGRSRVRDRRSSEKRSACGATSPGPLPANVEAVSLGLAALGVARGDGCDPSENRPEWLYTDLAATCCRGTSRRLPTKPVVRGPSPPRGLGRRVLLRGQGQVDKARDVLGELRPGGGCPHHGRGWRELTHERLLSVTKLSVAGSIGASPETGLAHSPPAAERRTRTWSAIYTSGTTGRPRARAGTHATRLRRRAFARGAGMFGPQGRPPRTSFSTCPCSTCGRAISTGAGAQRTLVHFAESIETVVADLAEGAATIRSTSRDWEKSPGHGFDRMASLRSSGPLQPRATHSAPATPAKRGRRPSSPGCAFLPSFAWVMVHRKLRPLAWRSPQRCPRGADPPRSWVLPAWA